MQSSRIPHTSLKLSTRNESTVFTIISWTALNESARDLSLSLSYSAAAAIAENMRNQAQSPKVQHVLTSPALSSLLFTLFSVDPSSSNFESESETHRVQGTLKWSQWWWARGEEVDGTHKQMNNSNHNATTLLLLLPAPNQSDVGVGSERNCHLWPWFMYLCYWISNANTQTNQADTQHTYTHMYTHAHTHTVGQSILNLFAIYFISLACGMRRTSKRGTNEWTEKKKKKQDARQCHLCMHMCVCVCEYLLQSVAKVRH